MATVKNDAAKRQIIRKLNTDGYPTYARLLNLFDIYLTDNPEVVGYMEHGKAKIVLNGDLDIEQISTVVRHELLHEWLNHGPRREKFGKENPQLEPEVDPLNLSNIAADFEISNVGYTDRDKQISRRIKLGDRVLQGLVTEDHYPDWTKMSYEDMYRELLERTKEDREKIQQLLDMMTLLNQEDLDDLQDEMQDQQEKSPSDKTSKLSKELSKVQDNVDNTEKKGSSNNPIDTPEERKEKEELAKRVEEIRKAFEDEKQKQEAIEDAKRARQKEKQDKIKKAEDRMRVDPLNKFKLNLNRFIADQIEEIEEETYQRMNPSYEDGEFILPGYKDVENKYIPTINVYHDTSGSFTSFPEKQEMVDRVIATLQKYEDNGDIKINRYYHADEVAPTRKQAGHSNNGNNVIRHILDTKPDNVIITTDDDLSDTSLSATVPGAVWMLFFDGRSNGLIDNLRGKRQTKIYDIEY